MSGTTRPATGGENRSTTTWVRPGIRMHVAGRERRWRRTLEKRWKTPAVGSMPEGSPRSRRVDRISLSLSKDNYGDAGPSDRGVHDGRAPITRLPGRPGTASRGRDTDGARP